MSSKTNQRYPDEQDLQAGDLLWARGAGSWAVLRGEDDEDDFARYLPTTQEEWNYERAEFLKAVGADPRPESHGAAKEIEKFEFEDFLERYLGMRLSPDVKRALSSTSLISTGHVATVAIDESGKRMVVEATRHRTKPFLPLTVQPLKAFSKLLSYDDWLKRFHKPIRVWQGRLQNVDRALPVESAEEALDIVRRHADASFSLWNFDLDDRSAFYCGKLAWMAVYRASDRRVALDGKVGPDGKPKTKRGFLEWCSPLDIMKCNEYVRLLFPPGTSPAEYMGSLGRVFDWKSGLG